MAVIVIVADSPEKAKLAASYLAPEGHVVTIASDVEQAAAALEARPAHAIVLDVAQVADYGRKIGDWVGRLRKVSAAPIMVLVDPADLHQYEPAAGIEDFLVWPCRPEELLARLRQLLHRAGIADNKKLIKAGDLSIDPEQYKVWVAGVPVTLTFKEFELLKLLASSPGRVFSREKLLSMVWGYDYFGGDRTVDVHVRRLRSKVEAWGHSFIETVRNVGYKFREQA